MAKFQVLKCTPMRSKLDAKTQWEATLVKGLFTAEDGEMDAFEVMLFPERGQAPVMFAQGDMLIPVIGITQNRQTHRAELSITGFKKPVAAARAA